MPCPIFVLSACYRWLLLCSLPVPLPRPKVLAKARIRHNGVSISKTCAILISIRLAARSLIFLTNKKCTPAFSGSKTGQDRYRLLLTNPLGSTELELNAQPGNVQLVDNKGQRYTADDAEEMIGKLTGMPIPLNSLRQWILGLPGDATDYKLDDQYRLSEITYSQNGKTGRLFMVVMTPKRNLRCQPIWNSPTVVNASS
ncbi:outer membrane lipoprotein LolB [Escherichia coli]|uniref:Outer-membrane lipoprotein LolB n=1 Tax=Escherichia coli TaxID=562 RepID=A0A376ZYH9_ECOLX|nr:outer membrane lipoprotein LolB [Escherichia coli]